MKAIYVFAVALLAAGGVFGQSYIYDAGSQPVSNNMNTTDVNYSEYPSYHGVKTNQPGSFSGDGYDSEYLYNFSVVWSTANGVWEFSSQSGTDVSTRVIKSTNSVTSVGDNFFNVANGDYYFSTSNKYPACESWSGGYTMEGACMKAIKMTTSGDLAQYNGVVVILKRFGNYWDPVDQLVNSKPRFVGKSGSDSLQYVFREDQWVLQKKADDIGSSWMRVAVSAWETLATNSNDTPSVPATGWTVVGEGSLSNDGSTSPLPVTWVSFNARPGESGTVKLEWQTSAETNSAFFDVERSRDGKTFSGIGQLKSAGNSTKLRTYTHIDASAPAGIAYYRLKQVDIDGTHSYSTIVSAKVIGQKAGIFPNPVARGSAFSLNIDEPQLASVRLYDLGGRELPVRTEGLTGKGLKISPAQALTPGMYLVKVSSEKGATVHKIMVQ